MAMRSRFDRFVAGLARVELSDRAVNQYRESAVRRRNLRRYFEEMEAIGPRLLLVGEAVSYRGGRLTGIPFVSESVMLCGVPPLRAGLRPNGSGHRACRGTFGTAPA